MRIMIGIGHPRWVYIWKNVTNNLVDDGHEIKIVVWDKDITLDLLDNYGFKYEVIAKNYKGLIKKAYGMFESDLKLLKVAKKFKPDIFISGEPYLPHVSKLVRKPHISFFETEHANLIYWLTYPFSDVICTPSCFKKKINPKKHIIYDGYSHLAYLHPNYFKPDRSVLNDLGLSRNDRFIILRFVSWDASHDIGHHGFTNEKEIIKKLEDHGKVFITSERKLGKNFERYRITIPPEKIHDLLYYATMYIGEGAAMATEAGILGTPSIYISSLAGTMGNLEELENRYKLVYSFTDPDQALLKALQFLEDENVKIEWQEKREKLLDQKIDVTKFMTEFIENYPDSLNEYKYEEGQK